MKINNKNQQKIKKKMKKIKMKKKTIMTKTIYRRKPKLL